MTVSGRRWFQSITGFFTRPRGEAASVAAKALPPVAAPQSGAPPLAAFIMRLRHEETLRARFVRDPRRVLREHGIDPPPFQSADRTCLEAGGSGRKQKLGCREQRHPTRRMMAFKSSSGIDAAFAPTPYRFRSLTLAPPPFSGMPATSVSSTFSSRSHIA